MTDSRTQDAPLGSLQVAVDEAVGRWFADNSSRTAGAPDAKPRFVLVTGTPASGKTRMRHQKYSHGYVNVDASDIFRLIPNSEELNFPGENEWLIDLIGARIANRAVAERRHIVTEVFGQDQKKIVALIDSMKTLGYWTELVGVRTDLERSLEWNLSRGPSNVSSYYTDAFNVRWLIEAAQLQRATLERAIEIAAKAHAGQVDKAGEPYVFHPLRMMLSVQSPEARMAAVLHDVVEDTPVTIEQLRAEGFPQAVIEAVQALTKRDGEDYDAFIRRVAPNPIARQVKLADLRDNCDLSRIAQPTEKDHERIEKYGRAIKHLESLG
jgi:hypothetical protein